MRLLRNVRPGTFWAGIVRSVFLSRVTFWVVSFELLEPALARHVISGGPPHTAQQRRTPS